MRFAFISHGIVHSQQFNMTMKEIGAYNVKTTRRTRRNVHAERQELFLFTMPTGLKDKAGGGRWHDLRLA